MSEKPMFAKFAVITLIGVNLGLYYLFWPGNGLTGNETTSKSPDTKAVETKPLAGALPDPKGNEPPPLPAIPPLPAKSPETNSLPILIPLPDMPNAPSPISVIAPTEKGGPKDGFEMPPLPKSPEKTSPPTPAQPVADLPAIPTPKLNAAPPMGRSSAVESPIPPLPSVQPPSVPPASLPPSPPSVTNAAPPALLPTPKSPLNEPKGAQLPANLPTIPAPTPEPKVPLPPPTTATEVQPSLLEPTVKRVSAEVPENPIPAPKPPNDRETKAPALPSAPPSPAVPPMVPPATPMALPSNPPPTAPSVWNFQMEITQGRTKLIARVHKQVEFLIVCDRVELKAPDGDVMAVGNVQIQGRGIHANCARMTVPLRDDRLNLEGKVEIRVVEGPETGNRKKNGWMMAAEGMTLRFENETGDVRVERSTPASFGNVQAPAVVPAGYVEKR